jgi:hypothetical protein
MSDATTSDDNDDGMCCAEITIATHACRLLNGYRDPESWAFVLHVKRVDGHQFPISFKTIEGVVEFVRELNPEFVHVVTATTDEHDALMADVRAHAVGALAAKITGRAGMAAPASETRH